MSHQPVQLVDEQLWLPRARVQALVVQTAVVSSRAKPKPQLSRVDERLFEERFEVLPQLGTVMLDG